MKTSITIQERLKDLRVERGLSLEQLSNATGISRAALGNYETDDFKEINHGSILTLAKFYKVSTDYLLCLTENRSHEASDISELHLTDKVLEILREGKINRRLLCEIIEDEDFTNFLADAEIYVDGIATARIKDMNLLLSQVRQEIIRKYEEKPNDIIMQTLDAGQIDEDDYFCHKTHKSMDKILVNIRKSHERDIETVAGDESLTIDILQEAAKYMSISGSPVERFCRIIIGGFGIDYDKLPREQKTTLQKVLKKSPLVKNMSKINQ